MILKKCRSKVWSLVSRKGANKLSRVESLNVRSWLLLFEDLPDLVADVVVQQLRPHHRHEHRPHNDPKLKKGMEGLLAQGDGWGFGGGWSAPGRLRPPRWNLARRSTSPNLVLLSLISPVDILVPVAL